MATPRSLIGNPSIVTLDGHPLMVVKGSYTDTEGQRFGDKISIGDIRYSDFSPYETAEGCARFDGGFGLLRYSDLLESQSTAFQRPGLAHTYTLECTDLDCSNGYGIMSGKRTAETLPANATPVFFMSEYTTANGVSHFIAVSASGIYERSLGGTWAATAWVPAFPPVCAAIFGNRLIIGYGATYPAQYSDDLSAVNSVTADGIIALYVFALTQDRSSVFMAGGPLATDSNKLRSSADGSQFANGSSVTVAPTGEPVVGIAPGGGVSTIFFATRAGLGQISTAGIVQALVPFDWPHATNGTGLGWWLGRGDDAQRGPAILHFVRDNDPYIFSPGQTGASGSATNIAPWADPNLQPPHQVGIPTAWFGTARYLYYAYSSPVTGNTYLVRRNFLTGSTLHYWDLGVHVCQAISMTDLFNSQPLLFAGQGIGVVSTPLQRSGGSPLSDTACRYGALAIMLLPGSDMGFPDEYKVEFAVRVEADNLAPGIRFIEVEYALDGEFPTPTTYTPLGVADSSPVSEIVFDNPNPVDRHMHLKLICTNTDETNTLILRGITMRRSINPTLYRWWEFDVILPAGEGTYADDLQNPKTLRDALWSSRIAGVPVIFRDEFGDSFYTRIMKLEFKTVQLGVSEAPQEIAHVTLLQASGTQLPLNVTTFLGLSGQVWPLPIPIRNFVVSVPATIDDTVTSLSNPHGSAVYPIWTVHGLAGQIVLTNQNSSYVWTWNGTLGSGDSLRINFDPTKKTVVDSMGSSQLSGVTLGSTWWGIDPGAVSVRVQVFGADTQTAISMSAAVE